jgi:very-short-patch-repair endonuclease
VAVDGHRYRLDFAWPEHKVALEADGFGAHSGYGSFHDDHLHDLRLRRADWDVLRVTDETPTQEIVDTVTDALAR